MGRTVSKKFLAPGDKIRVWMGCHPEDQAPLLTVKSVSPRRIHFEEVDFWVSHNGRNHRWGAMGWATEHQVRIAERRRRAAAMNDLHEAFARVEAAEQRSAELHALLKRLDAEPTNRGG